MARLRTGQPVNTSIRKLAFFVAAAVSGVSASSFAADNTTSKEDTITVSASAPQESAWGPAATIAGRVSLRPGPKPIRLLKRYLSLFLW